MVEFETWWPITTNNIIPPIMVWTPIKVIQIVQIQLSCNEAAGASLLPFSSHMMDQRYFLVAATHVVSTNSPLNQCSPLLRWIWICQFVFDTTNTTLRFQAMLTFVVSSLRLGYKVISLACEGFSLNLPSNLLCRWILLLPFRLVQQSLEVAGFS